MTSHQLSQLALCSLLSERKELSNGCAHASPIYSPLVAPRAWPEAVGSSPEICDLFRVFGDSWGPGPSAVSWSWGRVCADSSCSVLNVLSPTWEESAAIQPRPGAEPLAPTLALWPPPELVPVEVAALSSRAQGGALGFDQEQVSRPYKGWESALDRRLCDNLTQCGKGGCYCSLSQPARPRQCICGPEVEGEDWAQW